MLAFTTGFVVIALTFAEALYDTYGDVTGILERSWMPDELSKNVVSIIILVLFLMGIYLGARRYLLSRM